MQIKCVIVLEVNCNLVYQLAGVLGGLTSNGSPYDMGPLSVLFVGNVCVLWPNSWTDQDATTEVGLGPDAIVLDGDSAPPHGKGLSSSRHFSAHAYFSLSTVVKGSPISATAELLSDLACHFPYSLFYYSLHIFADVYPQISNVLIQAYHHKIWQKLAQQCIALGQSDRVCAHRIRLYLTPPVSNQPYRNSPRRCESTITSHDRDQGDHTATARCFQHSTMSTAHDRAWH